MKRIIVVVIAMLISLEILAQKPVDPMNIDQLKAYKQDAVKLKNAGMCATLFGLGFFVAGGTATLAMALGGRANYGMEVIPLIVGAGILAPCALVGVPLWVTGASRKNKAEIAVQKFNYAPYNTQSMAVKVTIRF